MTSFTHTATFEVYACCHEGCGLLFGLAAKHVQQLRSTKSWFYCPNGHRQHFGGENEAERRAREAEEKAQRAEQQAQYERDRAARANDRAAKVNRQYKRIRDRVKNGVCPCCNRTFEALARHIATKRPDFGTSDLLKTLRETYGLTQGALAEEIWTKPSYISNFENGRHVPAADKERIEAWLTAQQDTKVA